MLYAPTSTSRDRSFSSRSRCSRSARSSATLLLRGAAAAPPAGPSSSLLLVALRLCRFERDLREADDLSFLLRRLPLPLSRLLERPFLWRPLLLLCRPRPLRLRRRRRSLSESPSDSLSLLLLLLLASLLLLPLLLLLLEEESRPLDRLRRRFLGP